MSGGIEKMYGRFYINRNKIVWFFKTNFDPVTLYPNNFSVIVS